MKALPKIIFLVVVAYLCAFYSPADSVAESGLGAEPDDLTPPASSQELVPSASESANEKTQETIDADIARKKQKAQSPTTPKSSAFEEEEEKLDAKQRAARKTGIARMVSKLANKDGSQASIGILTPFDYTTQNFTDLAQNTVYGAIARYGEFNMRRVRDALDSLTLEQFRKVAVRNKIDISIVVVLKPTNFDIFLFDRRTPYRIFAHSEILPEAIQYQLTPQITEEYTKTIVRRVLYAYMQNQYFELPRQESKPILSSEIPRWVASNRSLATVNRELTAHYYASAGVGAALSVGTSKVWNSNLVGVQLGFRVFNQLYLEGATELFAYNSFMGSFRYLFSNLDSPFRFSGSLGLAKLVSQHTLNWDQHLTQGSPGNYLTASASVLFPIVDLHFKVEGRVYYGLAGEKMIFSVQPGLFVLF